MSKKRIAKPKIEELPQAERELTEAESEAVQGGLFIPPWDPIPTNGGILIHEKPHAGK